MIELDENLCDEYCKRRRRKTKISSFQPDRIFIENALFEFKKKGGRINKIDSSLCDFDSMSFSHALNK